MQFPFKVSLSAHDIACERGGRTLFQGLSFTLAPGEALLVSGPNGAGKTSLLRQLAGLLPLTAGQLSVTGTDEDLPVAEFCHAIGHLNATKTALTVRENLAFWADFLGEGHGDLEGALAAFGLTAPCRVSGRASLRRAKAEAGPVPPLRRAPSDLAP